MKFNTKKKKTYFECGTLIWSRFLLFFVNILTLYLHLTSTKSLKDLSSTRELKTKSRVKVQWKKVPSYKNLSLMYYIEIYPDLDQIFFINFSSGKS